MKPGFKSVIDALQRERTAIDEVLAFLVARAGEEPRPQVPQSFNLRQPSLVVQNGDFNGRNLTESITQVLEAVDCPIHVSEISALLVDGGFPYQEEDLPDLVQSALCGIPNTFAEIEDGYWVLAEAYP